MATLGIEPGGRAFAPGVHVVSVNVGQPAVIAWGGHAYRSAIVKLPIDGPVAVREVGLDGDAQADRRVHGGPEQAVYAYAAEDLAWWSAELGRDLEAGIFGENLTLAGVDVTNARRGARWEIGSVLLEVTNPRIPCVKLATRMQDARFVRCFAEAGRPGAYLRVIREGTLQAGDAVVLDGIGDGPSVAETARLILTS
jgi:MOSC domain-containing protein YiiM